jgi:hypothetical protein
MGLFVSPMPTPLVASPNITIEPVIRLEAQ